MATIAVTSTAATPRLADRLKQGAMALREAPLLAVVILSGILVVAVCAGLIAPHDPTMPVLGARMFTPPSGCRAEGGRRRSARTFKGVMC